MFSTPLRLMVRPFRGYRELADRPDAQLSYPLGALRFLLVIGGMVAFTATGRLAPVEAALAMISFAWLPVVHGIGIAVTIRALAPGVRFGRACSLHVESLGPWLVVFLAVSGLCLFLPDPRRIFQLLPALLVGATAWTVVLVFALFRAGLGLPRRRAAAATALFLAVLLGLVLAYYFAAGQLWPIL